MANDSKLPIPTVLHPHEADGLFFVDVAQIKMVSKPCQRKLVDFKSHFGGRVVLTHENVQVLLIRGGMVMWLLTVLQYSMTHTVRQRRGPGYWPADLDARLWSTRIALTAILSDEEMATIVMDFLMGIAKHRGLLVGVA